MRTVIQGSGRSLDEHAAPLRADRLRVVDHPAFVAEQAAREAAGGDRKVLNGIYWRLRTGSPWDDIPERYGPPTTCANEDRQGRPPAERRDPQQGRQVPLRVRERRGKMNIRYRVELSEAERSELGSLLRRGQASSSVARYSCTARGAASASPCRFQSDPRSER